MRRLFFRLVHKLTLSDTMSCQDALPAAVSAAAAAMAQGKSDEEVALLAAIFTQLGDSLAMIVALRACEKSGGSEAE